MPTFLILTYSKCTFSVKEDYKRLTEFLQQKTVLNEPSKHVGGVKSGMLNKALELSHAMEKLKINPDQEFESAIERFKDAREKATEAFCN